MEREEQTMNQEEPASEAQAEKTPEQEPATTSADLVIFCHPRNVGNLVRSFEDEIKHAAGALPMHVVWSGRSHVLYQGVIVLEWEGKVTPAFLHNLSIDSEIFDYVVYEYCWIENKDNQANNHESGK
jgi:hypothetical protein